MFGLFDYLKIGAGFIVGGVIVGQICLWRGEAYGRAAEQASARTRALELIQKRSKDNAEISGLDAARLCSELGGRWVHSDNRCD